MLRFNSGSRRFDPGPRYFRFALMGSKGDYFDVTRFLRLSSSSPFSQGPGAPHR
jgi:hypothetical protein